MSDKQPHGDRPADPATPSLSDAVAAAAQRSALGKVKPGEAPTAHALLGAMGGIRGLVESILPGLMFLIVYTITKQLLPSVLAPLAVSVVFIVVRIATRQPVTTAIAGALGIAISAGLALWTGRAEDNFLVGLWINGILLTAMLVSLAVRRPLIGVVVGLLVSDPDWRSDRAKFKVATIATVLWALLPAIRLAVELPLYLSGSADGLAAAKLVLGVPLYAILLWVTWLLIRTAWSTKADGESPDGGSALKDSPDGESDATSRV
jgi:hypothetical protein